MVDQVKRLIGAAKADANPQIYLSLANSYSRCLWELILTSAVGLPPKAVQVCWLHARSSADFEWRSAVNSAVNTLEVVVVPKSR